MASKSEPMSNIDAAWLHMEETTSMAMITGVATFDRPIDYKRMEATLEARFLKYDRFRQRIRESTLRLGTPRWEFDPHFDIHAHLHRIALPAPGDQAALQELVGDLMSTPLDFSKPLWQWHLVENYGSGCALIIRLHHCIADGLALMQVTLDLCDPDANAPWPEAPRRQRRLTNPINWILKPAVGTIHLANRTVRTTTHIAGTLLHEGFETLVHPERVLDAAKLATGGTRALGKLVLSSVDHRTIFKGNCGVPKRAAWSQPIDLNEIKTIGRAMEATVNDVLLAAVSGALRRYLVGQDQPVEGINIRAMVPVNIRPPEDAYKLGNRFGLVLLNLPIGVEDPLKRTLIMRRRMNDIKKTPEAVVAFGLLSVMGMTPRQIQDLLIGFFASKATAVMTNVPGPRQKLYMAGQRMNEMMFWVPSPGNLGLGVSIFSYGGEVIVGIATDACLVSDPQTIVDAFEAEVEQMKRYCGIEDEPVIKSAITQPTGESQALQSMAEVVNIAWEKTQDHETAEARTQAVLSNTNFEDNSASRGEGSPHGNGRCQAKTKAGDPCKNQALAGQTYCRVHTSLAESTGLPASHPSGPQHSRDHGQAGQKP